MNSSDPGTDTRKPLNIYERAGRQGAWLGLWLTAMFAIFVLWMKQPQMQFLFIVITAMLMMVPCIVLYWLRRTYTDCFGMATFSSLWMQGILTFGAGSLIASAVAFVFMRWISPEFNVAMVRLCAMLFSDQPLAGMQDVAIDAQTIIDRHMVPQPVIFSLFGLWLGTFTGSVISMFLAVLARVAKVPLPGDADSDRHV